MGVVGHLIICTRPIAPHMSPKINADRMDGSDELHVDERHGEGSHRVHASADRGRSRHDDQRQSTLFFGVCVFILLDRSPLSAARGGQVPCYTEIRYSVHVNRNFALNIGLFFVLLTFSPARAPQKGMDALAHAGKRGLPAVAALLKKA